MNRIKDILGIPFGVCSFSAVENRLINCRKKAEIPKDAKSIILFTFPYKVKEEKPENISRYAAVADYHPIVEERLKNLVNALSKAFPDNAFVPFADNSPIPEVYCAAAAGLGVIGKNGLLITKEYGSFVFIGEVVTNLQLETENKVQGCINCGACLKACPVGLNKEKCLSAVTQKKKELTEEEKRLLKENGSAWGCDICAEVCPMNKGKALTNIEEFINTYRSFYSPDESPENRPYMWRGKAVIDRNNELL